MHSWHAPDAYGNLPGTHAARTSRSVCSCGLTEISNAAELCPFTTAPLKWVAGPDLASFTGTVDDRDCCVRCAANSDCSVSMRTLGGDCFLKKRGPSDLLDSFDLSTTFCTPAGSA